MSETAAPVAQFNGPTRVNVLDGAGKAVGLIAAVAALAGSGLGSYGSYVAQGFRLDAVERKTTEIQSELALEVAARQKADIELREERKESLREWGAWREGVTRDNATVKTQLGMILEELRRSRK